MPSSCTLPPGTPCVPVTQVVESSCTLPPGGPCVTGSVEVAALFSVAKDCGGSVTCGRIPRDQMLMDAAQERRLGQPKSVPDRQVCVESLLDKQELPLPPPPGFGHLLCRTSPISRDVVSSQDDTFGQTPAENGVFPPLTTEPLAVESVLRPTNTAGVRANSSGQSAELVSDQIVQDVHNVELVPLPVCSNQFSPVIQNTNAFHSPNETARSATGSESPSRCSPLLGAGDRAPDAPAHNYNKHLVAGAPAALRHQPLEAARDDQTFIPLPLESDNNDPSLVILPISRNNYIPLPGSQVSSTNYNPLPGLPITSNNYNHLPGLPITSNNYNALAGVGFPTNSYSSSSVVSLAQSTPSYNVPMGGLQLPASSYSNSSVVSLPSSSYSNLPQSNSSFNGLPLPSVSYTGVPLPGTSCNGLPLHNSSYSGLPLPSVSYASVPLHNSSYNGVPLTSNNFNVIPLSSPNYNVLPLPSSSYNSPVMPTYGRSDNAMLPSAAYALLGNSLQQPNLHCPVQQPNLHGPVQQPNLHGPVQQSNLHGPVQQSNLHGSVEQLSSHGPVQQPNPLGPPLHSRLVQPMLPPPPGRGRQHFKVGTQHFTAVLNTSRSVSQHFTVGTQHFTAVLNTSRSVLNTSRSVLNTSRSVLNTSRSVLNTSRSILNVKRHGVGR